MIISTCIIIIFGFLLLIAGILDQFFEIKLFRIIYSIFLDANQLLRTLPSLIVYALFGRPEFAGGDFPNLGDVERKPKSGSGGAGGSFSHRAKRQDTEIKRNRRHPRDQLYSRDELLKLARTYWNAAVRVPAPYRLPLLQFSAGAYRKCIQISDNGNPRDSVTIRRELLKVTKMMHAVIETGDPYYSRDDLD